jgi:hypothetical protein
MSDEIRPLQATDEKVVLDREDYELLLSDRMRGLDMSDNRVPGSLDRDKSPFRVIGHDVYEVHYDSHSNPYLKHRGVLVDHE